MSHFHALLKQSLSSRRGVQNALLAVLQAPLELVPEDVRRERLHEGDFANLDMKGIDLGYNG